MRPRRLLNIDPQIPPAWRAEFHQEWVSRCYTQCLALAAFSILASSAFLVRLSLGDLPKILPNHTLASTIFLIKIVIGFVVLGSYLLLRHKSTPMKKWIILLCSIDLLWTISGTSFTLWTKSGINTPYIIGIITHALIFYRPGRIGLFAYLSTFFFYVMCLGMTDHAPIIQFSAYVSGAVATFGGWVLAATRYRDRVHDFINQRTIQRQSEELERVNQELNHLVKTDALTQVANRRYFDQYLESQWNSLNKVNKFLAIMVCDVDFFKLYNDNYGHQAGDDCLYRVA